MNTKLNIGCFPTAREVRAIESNKQEKFKKFLAETEKFICDELRSMIINAQKNDCADCTSKETTFFKFPKFVTGDLREMFIVVLMENLSPLGFRVYEEEDGARNGTGNVIVTWREQASTVRWKGEFGCTPPGTR